MDLATFIQERRPEWRKLEETRELATLVIVERAGDAHAEAPAPGWRVERVTIPRLDIASPGRADGTFIR